MVKGNIKVGVLAYSLVTRMGETMLNHEGTVLLETERLILRGLKLEDAPTVFNNWASDKEVAKFMRWDAHINIKVTKKWMKECEASIKDKSHYDWGIVLKETNEPIGSIGAFLNAEEPNRLFRHKKNRCLMDS